MVFFNNKLEDTCPFYGAIDTPVLDFWWPLIWAALFALGRGIYVLHVPRFTCGATPADLLMASMD